jgi:hypothetical protein
VFIRLLQNDDKIRKGKLMIESTISFKPNIGNREAVLRDLMRFLEEEEDKTKSLSVSTIIFILFQFISSL